MSDAPCLDDDGLSVLRFGDGYGIAAAMTSE